MKTRLLLVAVSLLTLSAGGLAQTSEADRDLRFADRLYDREEWDLAISQYREFLEKFPTDTRAPEARYRLADALFRKGQLEDAGKEFRSLLEITTDDNRRIRILARLGEIAYRQKDNTEAQSILAALLQEKLPPEVEESVRFFLAKNYQATGDTKKAVEELRTTLDRFPRGKFAHFATVTLAELYQAQGEKELAAATLREFAENNLGSDDAEVSGLAEEALIGAAQLQVELGNDGEAADIFHRFSETFPDSSRIVDALYGEARSLHKQQEFEAALPVLERLLPLIEKHSRTDLRLSARFLKGSCLFELGRYEESLPEFEMVLGLSEPRETAEELHPIAAAQVIQCYFFLGQTSDVIETAAEFEQRFPGSDDLQGRLLFFKGQALAKEGRHSEAIVEFALLLNNYPDHPLAPAATYQIGRSCLLDNQFERAARNLITYVEKYPEDTQAPEALYFAAEAYYRMQRFERSAELFQQLVNDYPDSPRREDAFLRWGESYVHLNDYDQVFKVFTQFLEQFPESAQRAEAFYYRGFVLQNRKDYAGAIENFDRLLEELPDSKYAADARLRKGLAQYQSKDKSAAAETFLSLVNDASAAASLDSNIYLWVADYLVSQQRYADAVDVYERAASRFPADDVQETSLYQRAECFQRMKQCSEATELYRRLIQEYPDSGYYLPAQYGLGVCLQKAGDHGEAAAAFAEAQSSTSNVLAASATFGYAEALRDQGKTNDAFTAFMKVALIFISDDLSPRAYEQMAKCKEALGQTKEAEKIYAELIDTYPDSAQARAAQERIGAATSAGGN